MKTLRSFLLTFCIASQLAAQVGNQFTAYTNLRVDSFVTSSRDFVIMERDTLTLARMCAYSNYFQEADYLLTKYNAAHADIHGLGLQAQVLYWMQAFDRSVSIYDKAIRMYPEPSPLYLDYARVLYGLHRLQTAESLLKTYRLIDSSNVEADIMMAYIHLWNGQFEMAGKRANHLLKQYPERAEAKDILRKITNYSAPYYITGIEFLSDDQPLKGRVIY